MFTCGANDVTQNLQAKDEYQVQRCFQCLVSPKICNEMKKLILHVKTLISKTEIVSLRETQNVPCSTRNLMHVTKPNVRDDQKYLGLLLSVLKHFVFLNEQWRFAWNKERVSFACYNSYVPNMEYVYV